MTQQLTRLATDIRHTLHSHRVTEVVKMFGFEVGERDAFMDLQRVAADPLLGLESPPPVGFVSSEDYLHKLTRVLNIEGERVSRAINEIRQQRILQSCAYPSWVLVETGVPIGVASAEELASVEYLRRFTLPKSARLLPLSLQMDVVRRLVDEHHQKVAGRVPVWGDVLSYRFFHSAEKSIKVRPTGPLTKTLQQATPMPLEMAIENKPVQLDLLAA